MMGVTLALGVEGPSGEGLCGVVGRLSLGVPNVDDLESAGVEMDAEAVLDLDRVFGVDFTSVVSGRKSSRSSVKVELKLMSRLLSSFKLSSSPELQNDLRSSSYSSISRSDR